MMADFMLKQSSKYVSLFLILKISKIAIIIN